MHSVCITEVQCCFRAIAYLLAETTQAWHLCLNSSKWFFYHVLTLIALRCVAVYALVKLCYCSMELPIASEYFIEAEGATFVVLGSFRIRL